MREKNGYRRRFAIGAAAVMLALGAAGSGWAEASAGPAPASAAARYNGDVYYYPDLKIELNGVEQVTGESGSYFNGEHYVPLALQYKGTSYVPIRYFASLVGIEDIGWDGAHKLIWVNSSKPVGVDQSDEVATAIQTYMTAKGSNHYEPVTLHMYPSLRIFFNGIEDQSGQDGYLHNGLTEVPKAVMHEGTTYVPLRYYATQLGIPNDGIVWDQAAARISISWENAQAEKPVELADLRGNSTGNLNNNGHYALHDGWLYYTNHGDEGKLYKQKADGSDVRKVADDRYVSHINVVNDTAYYLSNHKVMKASLDGTERAVLRDLGAGGLNVMAVAGDWIYYTEKPADMFGLLYRMKTDGSSIELLESNPVSKLVVDRNRIYYVVYTHKLFAMDTDGKNKKKLLEGSITSLEVAAGNLYFNNQGQLYSMSTNGGEVTKLGEHNAQDLNIHGDWLYYSNHSEYSKKLYRIHLTDATVQKLSDHKTFYLNIAGETIYYYNPDTGGIVSLAID